MCGRKTVIGVDTGGTFTDAVLMEIPSGRVVACSKARTDRKDLRISIRKCLESLIRREPSAVGATAVNLSTTLATNSLVEERIRPVCLVLIGHDKNSFEAWGFGDSLPTGNIVFTVGGHDRQGKEKAPLDPERVRNIAVYWKDQVEAFAISSLFGNRNPEHELRARAVIVESTGLPCTCGHELTGELNTMARASTAALNAGLVPTIREWLDAMQNTCAGIGIHASVYVVRGDGSLVSSAWAKERPVETILSGPAASFVGAARLAGETCRESCVALDMGGTTTDMAFLENGSPGISMKGVTVGRYKVMTPSIDIRTMALGGDSQVNIGPLEGTLTLGPLRATPLCLLPEPAANAVRSMTEKAFAENPDALEAPVFLLAGGPLRPGDGVAGKRILERIHREGALSLEEAAEELQDDGDGAERAIELVRAGTLELAAFTPTDALAALGKLPFGDAAVSRSAAAVMARLGGFARWRDFSGEVIRTVSEHLARFVLEEALDRRGFSQAGRRLLKRLAERMLAGGKVDEQLSIEAALHVPLLGIGAPAGAFIPGVAEMLKTNGMVPEEAPVANAIGAAAATTRVRKGILILPLPDGERFRVHLPTGVTDADSIEKAVSTAQKFMEEWLAETLVSQGVEKSRILMTREDHTVAFKNGSLLLDIVLWFEADGN